MATLKITHDLSEIEGVAQALARLPNKAGRIVEGAMWRASLLVEREVKERTPVSSGTLRASIAAREPEVGPGGVVGLIGTPLKYAVPVEDGSRAHHPPLQPLQDWVKAKLGVPQDAVEDVARRIAWKIALHGTERAGMFAKGFAATESQVERIFHLTARRLRDRLGEGT